jgi:hypothetical protein
VYNEAEDMAVDTTASDKKAKKEKKAKKVYTHFTTASPIP